MDLTRPPAHEYRCLHEADSRSGIACPRFPHRYPRKEAERGSANLVPNIFCENALETALQFREAHGGKITAITCGPETAEEVLRKALALKADEAALVVSDVQGVPDPTVHRAALGRGDSQAGSGRPRVHRPRGGRLGRRSNGRAVGRRAWGSLDQLRRKCRARHARRLKVKRQTDSGWESFEATLPLVATITNHEKNVPRIPKTRDVMQSFRKPITKWTLAELDLDPSQSNSYYEVAELSIPRKETQCEFVAGETLEEKVAGFAHRVTEIMRSI